MIPSQPVAFNVQPERSEFVDSLGRGSDEPVKTTFKRTLRETLRTPDCSGGRSVPPKQESG